MIRCTLRTGQLLVQTSAAAQGGLAVLGPTLRRHVLLKHRSQQPCLVWILQSDDARRRGALRIEVGLLGSLRNFSFLRPQHRSSWAALFPERRQQRAQTSLLLLFGVVQLKQGGTEALQGCLPTCQLLNVCWKAKDEDALWPHGLSGLLFLVFGLFLLRIFLLHRLRCRRRKKLHLAEDHLCYQVRRDACLLGSRFPAQLPHACEDRPVRLLWGLLGQGDALTDDLCWSQDSVTKLLA
mmetsp:Transcript_66666/g.156958  ORF Transcript_66666/g.156958 Transcript_66666/m.156958 type:complete len:238 (+) Transcript_66666:698-1411(+)